MTLASLLAEVETTAVTGPTDREISDLCLDSRRVAPGAVFFGLAGLSADLAKNCNMPKKVVQSRFFTQKSGENRNDQPGFLRLNLIDCLASKATHSNVRIS